MAGSGSLFHSYPTPGRGVGLLCNLMNGNVLRGRSPTTDERIYPECKVIGSYLHTRLGVDAGLPGVYNQRHYETRILGC
jgi:hypothetical protein